MLQLCVSDLFAVFLIRNTTEMCRYSPWQLMNTLTEMEIASMLERGRKKNAREVCV
jgi:hypothetical protein